MKNTPTIENQELQEEPVAAPISEADLATFKEMMAAGLMYGHRKSKTNPSSNNSFYH